MSVGVAVADPSAEGVGVCLACGRCTAQREHGAGAADNAGAGPSVPLEWGAVVGTGEPWGAGRAVVLYARDGY